MKINMSSKSLVMLGMIVGSTVGVLVVNLYHYGEFAYHFVATCVSL
ncbi:hypothetical protein HY085_01375 [Candidatus Gottesmanbacteria bacterium]|nr:hypothetical protein [Candidatus Gottesmanbacteria bacterium]